jgi:hypothetical protein
MKGLRTKRRGQSHEPCQFSKFAKFHELLFKNKKRKEEKKKKKEKEKKVS